jgi:YfiH family protein
MRFIQPTIFNPAKIRSAVSTRNGGVNTGFYSSLNMGKSTKDNPEHVLENRTLFFSDLGIDEEKTALSYQVHGCEILKAENPCRENGYDALLTNKKKLFLVVSIADCIPVLVYDPIKEVVAAIHAGWRGTASHIVLKTLQTMQRDYGSAPENCFVYIGPGLCIEHFEVGDEVAAHFSDNHKHFDTSLRKYFVDLKSANRDQALGFGVHEKNIEVSEKCTFCEENMFFSHRRDKGNTGRMVAVIGMK